MTDFLKQFQDTAFLFSPAVLCGIGFVLVWLGLCLWLGGLRWIRVLGGFSGAGLGAFIATTLNLQHFYWVIGLAILGGMSGIFMGKYAVVLLSGASAALVINLLLLMPELEKSQTWTNTLKQETTKSGEIIGLAESITCLEKYGSFLVGTLSKAIGGLGKTGLWSAITAALVVVGIGFVFPRLICSLTCSVLGVLCILLGLFFLLMYKGSKPLDYMIEKQSLVYMTVFAMILFGMIIDMALCPADKKKKAVSTSDKGDKK